MASKILNLYKEIGETPLERFDRFRASNPEYKDIPLSYAGRLDPMAEGVMIVLVGEENKNRAAYLSLNKEYVFEVLFGFETDSCDLLGKVAARDESEKSMEPDFKNDINRALEDFKGKYIQEYPHYSSKPVKGLPLFEWARAGKLDEIEIPKREVEVYEIKLEDFYAIPKEKLQERIPERIGKVNGDFRQKEIVEIWENVLRKSTRKEFAVAKIRISCGSGVYVRSIAQMLGEKLGTKSLAISIKRTRVGEWEINESLK